MIYLLQPPRRPNRISGGYRYNDEMVRRLEATQLGQGLEITAEQLAEGPPAEGLGDEDAVLILDSLYLLALSPPSWLTRKNGWSTRMLLHYRPSENPFVDEKERARRAAREQEWFDAVDGVVATSARLGERISELTGHHVHVATPGVNSCFRPLAQPPASSETLTVVCVGTVVPDKGQLELARALAQRETDAPPVRLVLIGDDLAEPEYRQAIVDAATGFELVTTGCIPPEEVAHTLQRAQLFVSASTFESYGMSVAEAAATGIPILCYRAGEVDRWVREGKNGYLVHAGDERSFALHLHRLLAEPRALADLREHQGGHFFPSWEYTFARFLRAANEEAPAAFSEDDAIKEVTLYSKCDLPTPHGTFEVQVYRLENDEEAVLIKMGRLDDPKPPFVRVHSECFTGEILHSLKCDCRLQLELAMRAIAERRHGAIVYLRQEGRGIGLGNKILAYAEQAKGANTIEANEVLGFPADMRDFRTAAAILRLNGVRRIHLNTNNPNKVASLEANGIEVEHVIPSTTEANPHNLDYLLTKYRTMGHAGLEETLHTVGLLPPENPGKRGTGPAPTKGTVTKSVEEQTLLLLDLDGVIQLGDRVPPEARRLVDRLREAGYALRFLTNDGINSRASRLKQLRAGGLVLEDSEIYTASYLAARYVRECEAVPILPLCGYPALEEFEGIERAGSDARAVVVGDYYPHYDYDTVKEAYDALEAGAQLVAMHKKRSWPTGGRRVIDIGFWVAGFEFCAKRPATIIGKPSEYSYQTVIRDAGFMPSKVIMISDEQDPDLHGARRWGIRTLHFEHPDPHGNPDANGGGPDPYDQVWEEIRSDR